MALPTWTREEIMVALNRAADEVLDITEAPDEGVRDIVNLIVNAGITYLTHPEANLEYVAQANYSVGLDEILRWCSQAS
jgi:hypothetical protein